MSLCRREEARDSLDRIWYETDRSVFNDNADRYFLFQFYLNRSRLLVAVQCDQMAKTFFNIWPFVTIKMCPIAFAVCQNRLKISRIPNNPSKYCPRLLIFAKVGKCRQIWSHCTRPMVWKVLSALNCLRIGCLYSKAKNVSKKLSIQNTFLMTGIEFNKIK